MKLRLDISAQLADGTATTINAEYLLVATGRGPVTTGLNAEGVGLQIEKGYIKVDELFRTSVPGISAIGDVITFGTPGHPQLAHVSSRPAVRHSLSVRCRRKPRNGVACSTDSTSAARNAVRSLVAVRMAR